MKKCKDCKIEQPIECFRKHSADSKYRRSYCNQCHNKRCSATRAKRVERSAPSEIARSNRIRERNKQRRLLPEFRASFIVEDSRKSDRKKGLENDLTIDYVESLIAERICCYCGETNLQITLDRFDNNIGHIAGNVAPACVRCNLLRGSMPFAAWRNMINVVRETREKGLFGDWTGSIHHR